MNRRELIKMLGVAPLLAAASPSLALNRPSEADYDLLVYGATPAGVACAVRAAREGLKVLLVSPVEHLGGMFANGLGIMDTLYNGSRAPIYDEFRHSIYDYYRKKYGTDSAQYASAGPGISKTKYEAKVAEKLINELLAAEPLITIIKNYFPIKLTRNNRLIDRVYFKSQSNQPALDFKADAVADCSYEGDLMVLSGAAFQYGRESKQTYGEKHAGVIYTKDVSPADLPNEISEEYATICQHLNLYRYAEKRTHIFLPESTGAADPAVQAFNLRAILTNRAGNRAIPTKPEGYDPDYFRKNYQHKKEDLTFSRPNEKTSLNYPKILGLQNKYVSGSWGLRKQVTEQFYRELTGLLYFRQNDSSLAEDVRKHWQQYGFAKDEFVDNNHLPYELYVRESRRLKGRAVFTEHNATLADGAKRAPVQEHSIACTEWFLDSHACTDRKLSDSKHEGEVMLKSETVPGQISLETLFPNELDNLIVPVCVSASHIGWGALRLEPVWMQLGEVAALVVVEARHQKRSPCLVNKETLSIKLANERFLISFFNDMEARESANWYPAVQYLGTKGFFGTYDARPFEKLTQTLAERWINLFNRWKAQGTWRVSDEIKKTTAIEQLADKGLTAQDFVKMLSESNSQLELPKNQLSELAIAGNALISRGDAARLLFELVCREHQTSLKF